MGFWHTGYIEHHEESGLGYFEIVKLPVYSCSHCSKEFENTNDLSKHSFESHPFTQPSLMVRGLELGTTAYYITRPAKPDDFIIGNSNRALLNGSPVNLDNLPHKLSAIRNDTINIKLINQGAEAKFEIVFRIADENHLVGVEESFLKLARKKVLNISTIEGFIEACSPFSTANFYYDGICHYLYGILAKERSADSSLPYEEYRHRFNRAADNLKDYDRGLAYIVRGLIAFHFNHFTDAINFAPPGRLRMVAGHFAEVLETGKWRTDSQKFPIKADATEDLLTDHETLRILRWASMPIAEIAKEANEIAALAERDVPELDVFKLKILIAEGCATGVNISLARSIAREMLANRETVAWAEHLKARLDL